MIFDTVALVRECFRRALAIRGKVLGADHPDTKSSKELVEEEEKNAAAAKADA